MDIDIEQLTKNWETPEHLSEERLGAIMADPALVRQLLRQGYALFQMVQGDDEGCPNNGCIGYQRVARTGRSPVIHDIDCEVGQYGDALLGIDRWPDPNDEEA